MNTKRLGKRDMDITPIGFGAGRSAAAWEFGWGPQDESESIAAIQRAWMPASTGSTRRRFTASATRRRSSPARLPVCGDRPYVFTKCCDALGRKTAIGHSLHAESIRRECEASLRRLRRRRDRPLPDPLARTRTTKLKRAGQRWRAQEGGQVALDRRLQFQRRPAEAGAGDRAGHLAPAAVLAAPARCRDEILPFCPENNIGVIVYSPMASGLLTGAMTRERIANLPADDWRRRTATSRSRGCRATWNWSNCSRRSATATGCRQARWRSPGRCATRR